MWWNERLRAQGSGLSEPKLYNYLNINDMKKKKPEEKKNERFEITELFMARNPRKGWEEMFWGVIFREKDDKGNEIAVNGKIDMAGDGSVWSRDADQDLYGKNLDDIIELRIENKIHADPGVNSEIADMKFFHN
jgi:hypothetical protein